MARRAVQGITGFQRIDLGRQDGVGEIGNRLLQGVVDLASPRQKTAIARTCSLALAGLCALLFSAPSAHANGDQGQIRVTLTIPERPPALSAHLRTRVDSEQLCSTARAGDRRELFLWTGDDPTPLADCSEKVSVNAARGQHMVMIAPI